MRILHLSLSLAYLTVALARPLIPKTINHLSEADRQKALQYQILKDTKGNPAAYEWIWFCGMVLVRRQPACEALYWDKYTEVRCFRMV